MVEQIQATRVIHTNTAIAVCKGKANCHNGVSHPLVNGISGSLHTLSVFVYET
jgi:hypothetical protein